MNKRIGEEAKELLDLAMKFCGQEGSHTTPLLPVLRHLTPQSSSTV